MRALVVESPRSVSLVERDEPTAGQGEVLVAPMIAGICGTDLELIDGSIDPAYVHYPLILGHEWVGEIMGDVPGVARRGDRVVVEGVIPCGKCDECQRGDTNRCQTYGEIGFTRPGAIAERIAVPTNLVHRLEPSVDPADAALIEPMAVVWRALTRLPIGRDIRVAIIGDGTIALSAAYLVRLFEPSSIVMIGRRAEQRHLAALAGATEFVTSTPTSSFDLVIEAAGNVDATATALRISARGAMVILLGLPAHGTTIEIAPDHVVNNDLIIQGSFSYTRSSWAQVVERVNTGELKPSFLITHRFEFSDALDAVGALRGGIESNQPRGKVAIFFNDIGHPNVDFHR